MHTTPILLTTAQLAERWQCSAKALANLRSAGGGIPYVKVGERVRYRLADVEAFESAHVVIPTASAA